MVCVLRNLATLLEGFKQHLLPMIPLGQLSVDEAFMVRNSLSVLLCAFRTGPCVSIFAVDGKCKTDHGCLRVQYTI